MGAAGQRPARNTCTACTTGPCATACNMSHTTYTWHHSLPRPHPALCCDMQPCSLQPVRHGSIIRQGHQVLQEEPGATLLLKSGAMHTTCMTELGKTWQDGRTQVAIVNTPGLCTAMHVACSPTVLPCISTSQRQGQPKRTRTACIDLIILPEAHPAHPSILCGASSPPRSWLHTPPPCATPALAGTQVMVFHQEAHPCAHDSSAHS
jgi:hypothetical protein